MACKFAKTGTGLFPLKMFTYLACERIVVTSALEGLGGFRECPAVLPSMAENGLNTAIVWFGGMRDPVGGQTMVYIRQWAQGCRKAGRQRVLEKFSLDRMVTELTAYYEQKVYSTQETKYDKK